MIQKWFIYGTQNLEIRFNPLGWNNKFPLSTQFRGKKHVFVEVSTDLSLNYIRY